MTLKNLLEQVFICSDLVDKAGCKNNTSELKVKLNKTDYELLATYNNTIQSIVIFKKRKPIKFLDNSLGDMNEQLELKELLETDIDDINKKVAQYDSSKVVVK